MINKELIRRNFSKHAKYYDRYSHIQNICASELIDKINGPNFNRILDIGCGTGNYTELLQKKFPGAYIKALDLSSDMIKVAEEKLQKENIDFMIADAETVDLEGQFDLISSNATFQWFENLDFALSRYKELLNKKGVISFTIFGPSTLPELDESLKELYGEDNFISAFNFVKKEIIQKILQNLFKEASIQENIYKQTHNSLLELLRKIKYTGTRGNGINKKNFWSSQAIYNLERIYKRKFGDITATYQVFFCRGVK